MNHVFRNTENALFVSFLMEIMPVTTVCSTQTLIRLLKEQAGIAEERQVVEHRRIDFRGLSPMEVRGQCSMVVGAVDHHLIEPERAALWTRYGHRRRQAQGVRLLRDYLAPLLSTGPEWMQMALIWNAYGPRPRREDFSLEKIACEYDMSKTTLHRIQQTIKKHHRALEKRAIARLDELFERTNLVRNEEFA